MTSPPAQSPIPPPFFPSRLRVNPSSIALRGLAVLLAIGASSCRGCDPPPPPKPAAEAGSQAVDAAPEPQDAAPPEASIEDASSSSWEGDAGATACKLTYGPMELPFRGPATLDTKDGQLRIIANDGGKPRLYAPPTSPPTSFVGMRWPPCEIAGRFAYCQGPGGPIYRTTIGKTDTKQVATSRSGTRIAAAALGDDHAVVVFLQSHRTTEGEVLQAFAVLDDGESVRLSDEGAGATTVRMVQRGQGAVALYLDTRTAMVPVHARPVTLKGSELSLGEDAVVFVGGAPERGIDFTAASAGADVFALVPMPKDTLEFGMAAIPIDDPPKMDVPATWSLYPNGLDPAPIDAESGASEAWVARMVPRDRSPSAPRVLELGRLGKGGHFRSLGIVAQGRHVTDIAVHGDGAGVWIAYGDTTSTWLERRICP